MTKIEAIKKYWEAEDKMLDATWYDGNGMITVQPRGLKGSVTKAAKRAIKLCDNDREFIALCNTVREEMKKEGK